MNLVTSRSSLNWQQPPAPLADFYLSGPMTGIKDGNYPAFDRTAKHIRDLGHTVCNPAELGAFEGWQWEDYLRRDLRYLLDCRSIAVMRGWQKSRGARLEVAVARSIGMPMVDADTLEPWGTPPGRWHGQVIGLWGVAKAGKDTIAAAIGWERAAHADELKADLDVFISNHVKGDLTPVLKEVVREVYVAAGRVGRALNPEVWIDRLLLPADRCVITDVRYLNEMKWVWAKGGMIFEIVRPGYIAANEEERQSFARAREYIHQNCIEVPQIINDSSPSHAAWQINTIIQSHLMRAA